MQRWIFLSGGLLPRLAAFLDATEFRRTFEDRAPYTALAARIPTWLVIAPHTVLEGMAAIATNADPYLIDYDKRRWR